MLASMHAAAILLYGPMGAYALLAVVAGVFAIGRRGLPGWFWVLSLLALVLVGVQAAAGFLRLFGGARPERALHLLYGMLVLVVGFAQYGLRPGGFFRRVFARELTWGEARTLALVALTQAALIGRAWMTGLGGR
jgi:hypothetical protein